MTDGSSSMASLSADIRKAPGTLSEKRDATSNPGDRQGFFKDTLPTAPVEKLALLRLDGDLYESTMDGLVNLYHKLSYGGTLIVDDYYLLEPQRKAIDEFRATHGIVDVMHRIDCFGGYWIKGSGIAPS
jgi:hypothetical protein